MQATGVVVAGGSTANVDAGALLVSQGNTLDDYPMIAGEVGVTAPTAWQLSQLWLHMSAAFRAIAIATERPRQIALNAIATAPDESTLQEAETAFAQALITLETFLPT